MAKKEHKPEESNIPTRAELFITESELKAAKLTPKCIVKNYFYSDVAQLIAPGGVGKTTVTLHESICVALGRPVWGNETVTPGWTLLVTAEDQRERLVARLREMMTGMDLNPNERDIAMRSVLPWDITGENLSLISVSDGNIVLTSLADDIIRSFKDDPPVLVIFDPLVSFGAGEERVNSNEQGLILAARRIVKGLDCCVRYVHHSGQAHAREKQTDQYAGRGGTAMPDGTRMTFVMHPWKEGDNKTPPPECTPEAGAGIISISRPKLSFSPPDLPDIWLKRKGYSYEHFINEPVSAEQKKKNNSSQVMQFLIGELAAGRKHTRSTLDDQTDELKLTRKELRTVLGRAESSGDIYDQDLPKEERHGRRKSFLMLSKKVIEKYSPHLSEKLQSIARGIPPENET